MYNLDQRNFDLLANQIYTKIEIVPTISMDYLGRQYDVVVQPARRRQNQLLYCEDVSFSYFFSANCKGLACPIDKVMQNN